MTLQYVAKSISNFKPAKFIHVRTGAHNPDGICRFGHARPQYVAGDEKRALQAESWDCVVPAEALVLFHKSVRVVPEKPKM